ncbi:hypothetical protein W59_01204 [Rhodococcus opacus RKJ300 = JCM 13270]|uniref:Uncharacterized protein n=1 Tax=Rhodococcus opacus RKJ300 = JCM 13270 TaxID=1165867 RepID=I0WZC9_RHOOP|nr:hypothetical protein W59_01204 [Rhodococcus opacus RKJ300 = JCM 13270]
MPSSFGVRAIDPVRVPLTMSTPVFTTLSLLLGEPRITSFESLFPQGLSPSTQQRTGNAGLGVVPDRDVMLLRPSLQNVRLKAFGIAEHSEFRLILAV